MQVPAEITYVGVERTDELEDIIQRRVAKLEKVCNYIISVHIAIRRYTKSRRTGNAFDVRIDIRIPRRNQMVVKRVSTASRQSEPLPALVRRAFDSAERQLASIVQRQRNEVKVHPQNKVMALVNKIFREEGYGFLKSLEGQQIYFHKNACLHGEWERMKVGTGVRYVEEQGEKGLQASTVEIVDKRGAQEMHEELNALHIGAQK